MIYLNKELININTELCKYIAAILYGLNIDDIKNLKISNDIKFDYGKNTSYSLEKYIFENVINEIKNIGVQNPSNSRICFVIESDIINYFLSENYIKYRLIFNYIKLLNQNGIGVDIISNSNISTMLPEEMKKLDITINFSYKCLPEEHNVVELLKYGIEEYDKNNSGTMKYLCNTELGLKSLIEANIPENKKALLLHTQEIVDYPSNNKIDDTNNEVLNLLLNIKDIGFDIISTSEDLTKILISISADKKYCTLPEIGYSIDDVQNYCNLNKSIVNRDILVMYSNDEDLQYVVNSAHPLGNDITILVDDNTDIESIKNMLIKDMLFYQFRFINKKYLHIIKSSYSIYIDFNEYSNEENIELMLKGNNIVSDKCEVYNKYLNDNFVSVDKTNIILLIKTIIVLNPEQYSEIINESSFVYQVIKNAEENKKIQSYFLG